MGLSEGYMLGHGEGVRVVNSKQNGTRMQVVPFLGRKMGNNSWVVPLCHEITLLSLIGFLEK